MMAHILYAPACAPGNYMIAFNDIIQRLEKVIASKSHRERVYNKDIAQTLDLTPEYFAVIKKRGKIPYESIAAFCHREKISMNWILFGQEPKRLS